MSYPAVTSRRMPYDIDGTEIGYNTNAAYNTGITAWLDSSSKGLWNKITNYLTPILSCGNGEYINRCLWFFFPERREIEEFLFQIYYVGGGSWATFGDLQGSNNTTNGVDGTWETATWPDGSPMYFSNSDISGWRSQIKACSLSTSYKTIRIRFSISAGTGAYTHLGQVFFFHLYGRKAAGETLDDILVLDNELEVPAEFTALKDWGDRPEGTTIINSIRLKNDSATKVANNINIQLNNADYLLSWNQISWAATLDIASLSVGSVSSPIYIKQLLNPPLLILGPRAARINITVGSWT